MARILGVAALSLLIALPPALGGSLKVQNTCNFKIWCSSAKNDGTATDISEVLPGQWYTAEKRADNDNIGAVLKCALNPYNGEPYQVELAVQDGRSWLDLSAVDGHPFLPYHRHAEIPGTICVLDCPPGVTTCEWTTMKECYSVDDAIFTPC